MNTNFTVASFNSAFFFKKIKNESRLSKTSMLERLIYNNYDPDKEMFSTKEDIYLGHVDIRNRRELLRIHDTSGEEWIRLACPPRHLCHYGDAFLLKEFPKNILALKL